MPEGLSTPRRWTVRILATLGLALFGFFFSTVVAEALGGVDRTSQPTPDDPPPSDVARMGASRPAEAVHVVGALGVLTLAVSGLSALIVQPNSRGAASLVLASMAGALITVPLVGNPDNVGGQAGAIDPLLLILASPGLIAALLARPWRHEAGPTRWRFLGLAAIAAIPLGWYGVDQALLQRNSFPPTADPHHNAHWWTMSMIAFTVVLAVATSARGVSGWRFGALISGLVMAALGAASLASPSSASALESPWAGASIAWGLAAIGSTWRRVTGRHTDPRSRPSHE